MGSDPQAEGAVRIRAPHGLSGFSTGVGSACLLSTGLTRRTKNRTWNKTDCGAGGGPRDKNYTGNNYSMFMNAKDKNGYAGGY